MPAPLPPASGPVHRVALDAAGRRWALLREPAGADEEVVGSTTTADAVRLLDRLIVAQEGAAVAPGTADRVTVAERDLLLAAAYRLGWGPRVTGVVTCSRCAAPFDVDFRIEDLARHVRESTAGDDQVIAGQDGTYQLPGGVRFRLPTAQDEAAVTHLNPPDDEHALLLRCLVGGDPVRDASAVEDALARVGAGMDLELGASCPECGHDAQVRFGIQDYLLGAMRADRAGLLVEVHRLALAYHWSLGEILGLPRTSRRSLVALLDGELPALSPVVPT